MPCVLLVAALGPIAASPSAGRARDPLGEMRDLHDTARVRAAVYARGVRTLEEWRATDSPPSGAIVEKGRSLWRRIEGIPAELAVAAGAAKKLAASGSSRGRAAAPDSVAALAAEVGRLAATVGAIHGRCSRANEERFGAAPFAPAAGPSAGGDLRAPSAGARATGSGDSRESGSGGAFISGEVALGGGGARFRPLNVSGADASEGTLEFSLRGGTRPSENSNLSFHAARGQRVEQIATTATEFAAAFEHTLNPRFHYRAEAGYSAYGESDADARDYGEWRLRTSGRYRLASATNLDLAAGVDARRHAQTSSADFSTRRFDGAVTHKGSNLRAEARLSLQGRSAEAEALGFVRSEPAVRLEFVRAGAAPSGIAGAMETYSYSSSSAASSRRLRVEGYVGRGTSGRIGAALVRFDRPDAPDSSGARGYDDVTVFSNRRWSSSGRSGARDASATYRRQRSEAEADFVDIVLRDRHDIRGSWAPRRELGLAARVFRNEEGRATEQHTADVNGLVGWNVKGPAKTVIALDATVGGRTFLDPDRAKHQDLTGGEVYDPDEANNFNPDDDGFLQNPRNTLRFGGAARAVRTDPRGVSASARVTYTRDVLYNADPVTSRGHLGLEIEARRRLGPAWMGEARLATFRSRSSEATSPSDFDRFRIEVRATYLFSLSRGAAR